jgi:membrane protease YdiL (CAAX protease family)
MTQLTTSKKDYVWLYVLVAIGFSAVCWITGWLMARDGGYVMPIPANFFEMQASGYQNAEHRMIALIFQAATYGPLIGALVAAVVESGRVGLTELWRKLSAWRVTGRIVLAVVVINLIVTLLPSLLAMISGIAAADALFITAPITGYLLLFGTQLLTSGLGEEVGWRGYMLPRLLARENSEKTLWISGLIWAAWHYPFVIFLFFENTAALPLGQQVMMVILSLAGFTMTIIGQAFIYAWLINNGGSVFWAVVYHALSNTLAIIFGGQALAAGPMAILPAIMPWIVVWVMQKRLGKESFLQAV